MSNETQHIPGDVRELVAREVFALDEDWRREYWDRFRLDFPWQAQAYYDTADRILALLRTPSGEGEEDGGEFCDLCGEGFDPGEIGTVIGPLGEDDGVPRWYRCPRCARAYDAGYQQGQRDPRGDEAADPTALRSEAPGEGEADALDLLRWAEARSAVLEPVAGNVMPPGTYACYVEGVGDDPAEYEDAGEPYMGPGILGAIRAARLGEGGGDG